MKQKKIAYGHPFGISVIVTPTDNPLNLSSFIKSFILNNTLYPYELILPHRPGDASIDPIIDRYSEEAYITRLACPESSSEITLKNTAADKARYPYLLFISSNIIYNSDILPLAQLELLNPEVGLIGCNIVQYPTDYQYKNAETINCGITFKWNYADNKNEPIPVIKTASSVMAQKSHSSCLAVSKHFQFCRKENFYAAGCFSEKLPHSIAEIFLCLKMQKKLKKNSICLNTPAMFHQGPLYYGNSCKQDSFIKPNKALHRKTDQDLNRLQSLNGKVAVVCHLYYLEQWPDLARLISNIPVKFQLYVTIPDTFRKTTETLIRNSFPRAIIRSYPNHGRDIAPFIEIIPEIVKTGCQVICKIHTKQDDFFYGDAWRQIMWNNTLGLSVIPKILEGFATDQSLGMVGPKILYKSSRAMIYNNLIYIDHIFKKIYPGKKFPADWGFFAGSCFWIRPRPLMNLADAVQGLKFEADNTKKDGQLAHALERLFGLSILESGLKVGLVTNLYSQDADPKIEIFKPHGKPSKVDIDQTVFNYHYQSIKYQYSLPITEAGAN